MPIQRISGIEDAVNASVAYNSFDDVEDSAVAVGFNAVVVAGAAYEVTEKIAPYIELGIGFGTSFAFDVRVGVIYRLGGGSGSGDAAPAEESGE